MNSNTSAMCSDEKTNIIIFVNINVCNQNFQISVSKTFLNETCLKDFISSFIYYISDKMSRENMIERMKVVNQQDSLSSARLLTIEANQKQLNYNTYKDCSLYDVFSSDDTLNLNEMMRFNLLFSERTDY